VFAQHEALRHTIEEILRREGIEASLIAHSHDSLDELTAHQVRPQLAIIAYAWDPAPARELAGWLRTRYPSLPLLGIDDPGPTSGDVVLCTPFSPLELSDALRRLLACAS
jgi:DNA-binding response OmpR family regulator